MEPFELSERIKGREILTMMPTSETGVFEGTFGGGLVYGDRLHLQGIDHDDAVQAVNGNSESLTRYVEVVSGTENVFALHGVVASLSDSKRNWASRLDGAEIREIVSRD